MVKSEPAACGSAETANQKGKACGKPFIGILILVSVVDVVVVVVAVVVV